MNHHFDDVALSENDLSELGVFLPDALHTTQPIAPTAVLCFFGELLDELVADGTLRVVYELRSEIGRNPVYEMDVDGRTITVVHPGVGAPLAACFMEETAALGVRTFVAVGGAGALRHELDLGHAMIVTSALRDEGTSFHYAPPGRVLDAQPLGVRVLREAFATHAIPFLTGRVWTTDGLFRETRSRVERRVAEGCQLVDMEASALIAVAKYRNLRFAQILYAGDQLAGDEWDSRHWDAATSFRRALFHVAATAAITLHDAEAS